MCDDGPLLATSHLLICPSVCCSGIPYSSSILYDDAIRNRRVLPLRHRRQGRWFAWGLAFGPCVQW